MAEGSTLSVLVVEDSPSDALFVMEALEASRAARFKSNHVMNLNDALRALHTEKYDVVLLDLGLPDASGVQAVSRVCDDKPDIPVVVLTGNAADEVAVEAIRQGAQDFLVKQLPFPSGERLARTLCYAVARRSPMSHLGDRLPPSGHAAPRASLPRHESLLQNTQAQKKELDLDVAKGRLQMLAMVHPSSLQEPDERRLLRDELRRFLDLLQGHFSREERACLAVLAHLPRNMSEAVNEFLDQHASLLKEFSLLAELSKTASLADLKRSILAGLCHFIEHEIAESTLLKAIEAN